MNYNTKLDLFRKAIERQSEAEIAQIEASAPAAPVYSGTDEEMEEILNERQKAQTEFNKEAAKCGFETNKSLLAHRKSLVDGFFEEITKEVAAFAMSKDYDKYLNACINKAYAELGVQGIVFYTRMCDIGKLEKLTDHEINADINIKVGGLCAENREKGLYMDLTLDKAIADEKAAFSTKKELML